MSSSVRSCWDWRLYVIVDRAAAGSRDLAAMTAAAIRGGADVIQLRDKTSSDRALCAEAARLLPITRAAGIPLIINDRVDVASAVDADGVHLGQDDLAVHDARRLLGPDRVIGKSTHSLAQARAAQVEAVDYLAFGPIFPTPTKPDSGSVGTALIGDVISGVRLPVVCIGGIELATLTRARAAGAARIAVVRAVCCAEDPEAAAKALKDALQDTPRDLPQRVTRFPGTG